MERILVELMIAAACFALGAAIGFNANKATNNSQIIQTQVGPVMIKEGQLFIIEKVKTVTVDPTLLTQLAAKLEGDKK